MTTPSSMPSTGEVSQGTWPLTEMTELWAPRPAIMKRAATGATSSRIHRPALRL